ESKANNAGQEPSSAHIGPREADLRKEESDLGGFRRNPHVARSRDDRARTGHRAVQSADDGPAAMPHRENEVAGEARELLQRLEIAAEQRTDDVLDVAAGAEGASGARDDDGAHARLGVEPPERVAKLLIDLKRQRIETFGPVEGDGRDRGLGVEIIQK